MRGQSDDGVDRAARGFRGEAVCRPLFRNLGLWGHENGTEERPLEPGNMPVEAILPAYPLSWAWHDEVNMVPKQSRVRLLGVDIDPLRMSEAVDQILSWTR